MLSPAPPGSASHCPKELCAPPGNLWSPRQPLRPRGMFCCSGTSTLLLLVLSRVFQTAAPAVTVPEDFPPFSLRRQVSLGQPRWCCVGSFARVVPHPKGVRKTRCVVLAEELPGCPECTASSLAKGGSARLGPVLQGRVIEPGFSHGVDFAKPNWSKS